MDRIGCESARSQQRRISHNFIQPGGHPRSDRAGSFPLWVSPLVPILAAFGTGVGGNFLTRALEKLGAAAVNGDWEKEDELGRLFLLMEFAFSEELPDLDHDTLKRRWATDSAFLDVYHDLAGGADATDSHPVLLAAIEPLVTATDQLTAHQVAERIAQQLPEMLLWAMQPADRVLLAVQRARNEIQGVAEDVQAVGADVRAVGDGVQAVATDVQSLAAQLDRIEVLLTSRQSSQAPSSVGAGAAGSVFEVPALAGLARPVAAADPWPLKDTTRRILADSRRVVPFVGSGLTVKARMPVGAGLAEILRTEHPLAAGVMFSEPDNLISVSNQLAAQHADGRRLVAEFIIERLDIDAHGYTPTPAIRNLVQVPSNWYVTTTYDLLPERAAADAGIEYESFTWRNLPPQEHIDRDVPHKLCIVHLHGSVEDPDSLILDGQSYRDISNQGEVRQFLEALFHEYRVCFMGTALDEQYLQAYLLSWRGSTVRHVLVDDERGIQNATQSRGAILTGMHGVATEAFPAGQWDLLDAFTRNLVTRPASSAVPLQLAELRAADVEQPAMSAVSVEALPPVRYLRSDWGPAWTRRALDDLARNSEEEAFQLQSVLRGSDDPAVVRNLIEQREE